LRVELNEDEEDLGSDDEGSEEGSDEDDYYDEEIDDDDEDEDQEEIFVGRNPEIDRLSNLDVRGILAGAAGPGGRLGNFRRDDLISMNNMSVDMINLG